MRLILLLTIIFSFKASAALYAQQINLNLKEQPIEKAFDEIEKQSGYQFFYNDHLLDNANKVSVNLKNATLQTALDECFKNQTISYEIFGKSIVIKLKMINPALKPSGVPPPASIIKGRVTDSTGKTIPGVSIKMKGRNLSTVTNENGDFNISAPVNSILIFSAIGFETVSIPVDGKPINLILHRSLSKLDEVQVIAYGSVSKRLNTGSVSTVSASDIASQPVSNPLAALEGRVPGMLVTQTSGLAGGAFKVQVRGRTSIDPTISDGQPLFVIDGVPYGPNNGFLSKQPSALGTPTTSTGAPSPGGISPLNSINPQDIESIEVLKDADATAIYGSRGANGVILITTKKGKVGKTTVNFNSSTGFSEVANPVQMLGTPAYLQMRRTAYKNEGATPTKANAYDLLTWDTTRYTNFPKLLTGKTAVNSDAQLSIGGGSANTQFLLGGSFNRQTSVFPGDLSYKRAGMHFNINHSSNDQKFKLSFTGSYSADRNNLTSTDLSYYYYLPPNLRVYDGNGNIAWNEGGVTSPNPLAYLNNTYDADTKNLVSDLLLSYKITNGLTVRVNAGYNNSLINELSLNPSSSSNPASGVATGASSFSDNQISGWITEPQAEYKAALAKGQLSILLGGTLQATNQSGKEIDASGYTSDDLMKSLTGATDITGTNSKDQYRYQALFARINYNWQDRYLINVSARRDGSSRFAPENRFANFGSIGAAWLFSNESFFKDKVSFLSFGKIRGSYGTTGNDKITNYQFLDTWASTYSPYNGNPGLYPSKLYNPDYHWEKTNKYEAAIELGFFKDRVLFTSAYFNNRSSNQLVQYPLPGISGFSTIIDNLPALVVNSGLEFTVTSTNIKAGSFKWSTSANFTIPKNKLVSYPGLSTSPYNGIYQVGQPLNLIYKYKSTGVDPQTGLFTFQDVDKNGSYNVNDRQALGSLDPKFYGGLQNSFRYKNFQFDFFFTFTKQVGKTYLANLTMPGLMDNIPAAMSGFWTKPGDNATFQKLSTSKAFTTWTRFENSNGVYGDASYIRLKNTSFSYNLNGDWMKKIGVESCRVYLEAQNLFTITGYKVGDPETQSLLRTGPLRVISAGLQFSL